LAAPKGRAEQGKPLTASAMSAGAGFLKKSFLQTLSLQGR
jgi:hypothetical protein